MKNIKELFDKFETKIDISDHDEAWRKSPELMTEEYEKNFGLKLEPRLYHPIVINWSEKGRGFGQYIFYQEDGKIYCLNECDSKETVKRILCNLVDQAEFIDN